MITFSSHPNTNSSKSILLRRVGLLLLLLLLAALLFVSYLLLTEYRPADTETVTINGSSSQQLTAGQTLTLTTWNIGYAGLDASQDFFMDGGTRVNPPSQSHVATNLEQITSTAAALQSDIYYFQEIDLNAKRSYHLNQVNQMADALQLPWSFAYNFKVKYVPYPFPEAIGPVESGIMTAHPFKVAIAQRIQLPLSFKWPVSTCQLKRCLLVERLPIENSDQELVLVNLHLEAYDSGAGKIAQTQILTQLLEQEYAAGNYVIAGGDFNQLLPDVDLAKYPLRDIENFQPGQLDANILPASWQFVTDDTVPTCRLLNQPYDQKEPETNQFYVLDGFILSPNVQLLTVKTIDLQFAHTDHQPVQIKVTL